MPKQYENQEGLLMLPGTNKCAGYILNFTGHGAYDPTGLVKTDTEGPTEDEVNAHNTLNFINTMFSTCCVWHAFGITTET